MIQIGQLLLENQVITQDMLDRALSYQKRNGGLLGVILLELGYIEENTLLKYLLIHNEMQRKEIKEIKEI